MIVGSEQMRRPNVNVALSVLPNKFDILLVLEEKKLIKFIYQNFLFPKYKVIKCVTNIKK